MSDNYERNERIFLLLQIGMPVKNVSSIFDLCSKRIRDIEKQIVRRNKMRHVDLSTPLNGLYKNDIKDLLKMDLIKIIQEGN